jgi:hypothetical protein
MITFFLNYLNYLICLYDLNYFYILNEHNYFFFIIFSNKSYILSKDDFLKNIVFFPNNKSNFSFYLLLKFVLN